EFEHRRAQLVEAGERELHLRLDSDDVKDATPRGTLAEIVQQRGLADTCLSPDDEHLTLARFRGREKTIEPIAFRGAPQQHRSPSAWAAGFFLKEPRSRWTVLPAVEESGPPSSAAGKLVSSAAISPTSTSTTSGARKYDVFLLFLERAMPSRLRPPKPRELGA